MLRDILDSRKHPLLERNGSNTFMHGIYAEHFTSPNYVFDGVIGSACLQQDGNKKGFRCCQWKYWLEELVLLVPGDDHVGEDQL